jgi:hypothetical protein
LELAGIGTAGLKNVSFAPLGLFSFRASPMACPMACAMGCMLSPLYGWVRLSKIERYLADNAS